MLRDIPHDRAAAVLYRQVLHRDRTLAVAAVAVEGLHLGCEGAGQPGQCARNALLLRDAFGEGETAGKAHGRDVDGHHLRRQHGLERIPRRDAFHHRDHEGEIVLIGLLQDHAGFRQLLEDAMQSVLIDGSERLAHQVLAGLRVRMLNCDPLSGELDPGGGPAAVPDDWRRAVACHGCCHVDVSFEPTACASRPLWCEPTLSVAVRRLRFEMSMLGLCAIEARPT
uniref:hypothetical protein n=1 Tax=Bradyrhizobium ottawaense TaxID=931866 RepID=UPI003513FA03